MWEAVVAIIGVIAAGVGYWLKKSADTSGEAVGHLKRDLTDAKKSVKLKDRQIHKLKLLNAQLRRELTNERRKNFRYLDADGAVALLRGDTETDSSGP